MGMSMRVAHETVADKTEKTAIVVEGGAMRGIFSAGVLDVLHERGLRHFDIAIGTSAGACNLASFVAGQHERNLRCYTQVMSRPELFSARRALGGGHFMDLDWLWERFTQEDPLDVQAICRSRTQLISVATCARTGRPVYRREQDETLFENLKSGCAVPLLYRGPVALHGELLVDGGMSDPIPAAEAYRRGARSMLVIRSRPIHVTKRPSPADAVTGLLLRRHPALAGLARNVARTYRDSLAFLQTPPRALKLVHMGPSQPMQTGRTTQRVSSLQADYMLGRRCAEAHLPAIECLLAQDSARAVL